MNVIVTMCVMQTGIDKGFELMKRRLNVKLYIRLMQTGNGKEKKRRRCHKGETKLTWPLQLCQKVYLIYIQILYRPHVFEKRSIRTK